MAPWRDARNAATRASLERALPEIFPQPVRIHALASHWVPELPRRAVESYWAAHPIRADRLARVLAARSGAPAAWRWQLASGPTASFRNPPAPFREEAFARGSGHCCICGQPVFRFGWHTDLWESGPNRRARWHAACVAAWKVWIAPNTQVSVLSRLQRRRCAATGTRLLRTAEADHRIPLFRVWREERDRPWPELLAFWGFTNLQALNAPAHRAKSAMETAGRALSRRAAVDQSATL